MSSYTGNGQFDLERLSLFYSLDGNNESELNLKAAYVQLDLYESVFNHTMAGSLSIVDSFNLQDVLPLYGNERIELSFFTSGNDANTVEYSGIVYKISEKHRISEHTSGYIIHFITDVAIKSQQMNIQQAYKDNSSNVVNSIYDMVKSDKVINIEDTINIEHYVFGSFKPLQAISIISKRSQSKDNKVGYLFYEDNKEFNFKPLQDLYTEDSIYEYTSKPKGMSNDAKSRIQDAHKNIQQIKVLEENSYMDRMIEGQHGASFFRYDLVSKEYSKFEYDKKSEFDETKSLGKYPYKKELESSYENKSNMRYDSATTLPINVIATGLQSKIEISTIRVEMSIFGNSVLRCGKCIDIFLPNWNKDQGEVTDKISGKFLMGDIHHQIVKDGQYSQTIMLYKDSYEDL